MKETKALQKKISGDPVDAFRVSLLSVGNNQFLLFIKDESSKSDYIRLSYGYADSVNQKNRSVNLLREFITEPKEENGLFLGQYDKNDFKNKKLWIIFETVQRQKGKKGLALERFAGVSPAMSKWRDGIGSYTNFELRKISQKEYDDLNSTKKIEGVKKIT